jgi:hypothetical protein
MAETKKKLPLLGFEVDVSEVPIVETTEYFNQYKLEDGTVLKVKGVATTVLRADNQFLPDGSPIYFVYMNPVTKVQSSPLSKPPMPSATPEKAN